MVTRIKLSQDTIYFYFDHRQFAVGPSNQYFYLGADSTQKGLIGLHILLTIAIDHQDDISFAQAGLLTGRAGHDIGDHHSTPEEGDGNAGITVVEGLVISCVGPDVDLRPLIIDNEIETTEQVIADQSAKLGIACHVILVVKDIGRDLP